MERTTEPEIVEPALLVVRGADHTNNSFVLHFRCTTMSHNGGRRVSICSEDNFSPKFRKES